ncbi:MAG: GrpB family protein, partial [Opitutaceae bacterium]|nr:GrpB family protein [Opitutaceae bacterium]
MNRSQLLFKSHDQDWKNDFLSESHRIRTSCDCSFEIEHIGSTSIPGILAKPILD